MTMFTRRCSHHGPWRTEFAGGLKVVLMLLVLSSFLIPTFGQSVDGVKNSRSQIVSPWDNNDPQWFAYGESHDLQWTTIQEGVKIENGRTVKFTLSALPPIPYFKEAANIDQLR